MPVLDMTLARDGKICFCTSSVGRKLIMAITGFAFIGFVTAHMVGNLTAYIGIWDDGKAMNAYAAFLQGFGHGGGIWVARASLLGMLLLHVWAALTLTLDSWAARPKGYREKKLQATWASRSMRVTAVILALFIIYHLLHLTVGWGPVNPDFMHHTKDMDGNIVVHAFENFVKGFKNPIVSAIYIIANLCLGLHIWHGVWSFSQTLGLSHPRYDACRRHIATLWAMAVVGINISYPLAVLSGILKLS